MFTIKHELADSFGTRITSATNGIVILFKGDAGFSAPFRNTPGEDDAKAVIRYIDQLDGVKFVVVANRDRAWIMNANGKTVASI